MFLLPFGLFLITTYLRSRTQAELSYIITAIECMSGIWCLLFAPLAIQLTLIGLFMLRNAQQISTFLRESSPVSSFYDLSNPHTATIDVVASPIEPKYLLADVDEDPLNSMEESISGAPVSITVINPTPPVLPNLKSNAASEVAGEIAISTHPMTPPLPQQPRQVHLNTTDRAPQTATLVPPPQVIEMRYRGVAYLKYVQSIPTRADEDP